MNPKIIPCLWFDNDAEEAVNFYIKLFENSRINEVIKYGNAGYEYHHKPADSIMTIEFELANQKFLALNGGPIFKFSEAISLFVYCENEDKFDFLYNELKKDGMVLMEAGKYEWSPKYAWVKDKYGLSWQLDIESINSSQKIVPSLLFVQKKFTLVREAVEFYCSIFQESKIIMSFPYPSSPDIPSDTLLFSQFSLNGYLMNAMSSNYNHEFDFNESISFMVMCESQNEIDYYWEKLLENGNAQQCGWLKDKYGISWQVVPAQLNQILAKSAGTKKEKILEEIFKMIKLDWNKLQELARD